MGRLFTIEALITMTAYSVVAIAVAMAWAFALSVPARDVAAMTGIGIFAYWLGRFGRE